MLTEFVLITVIWARHGYMPVSAEVFPNQAACQRALVDKHRQYCVPLIKTVAQPTVNQTPAEERAKEKK